VKTVVIGASGGLGRRIAVGLAHRGAQVAALARRADRLAEAADAAGPGTLAIECDVTDQASCRDAIEAAAAGLGGIDALIYAPGVGPLGRIEELDAETWRRAFDTNCLGATLATAAALPHLQASRGVAAYLSTVSASLTSPWPGLGAYVVTKAALDKLVDAWRSEHPEVGFTRVVVGDCQAPDGAASEFNAHWDMDLASELVPLWTERGLRSGSLIDVEELVDVVDRVLRCGGTASIPSVALLPRPSG
jgi:NAD(P)-dependent dehydrogenase (short-subunit alcohol dehydrogenase family)